MTRFRDRLTYANIVATIALVAALGTGGAYAATELAKHSVGAKELRRGAVTSRVIKNRSVAVRDLSAAARANLGVQSATVQSDGTLLSGSARAAARDSSVNGFVVSFKQPVSDCTFVATLAQRGTTDPTAGTATIAGSGGNQVTVRTYDATGAPALASFDLLAAC